MRKRCTVAYAAASRQLLIELELDVAATVADALEAARARVPDALDVPWESAPVGIFGEQSARDAIPRDGDRIELYRPLAADPRERRRERVRRAKIGRGGTGRKL